MQWTAASCDQHDQHDPPAVNRNSIEQRTPANNCEVDPMDATGSTKHPHLPKQREADRPVSGSGGGSSSLTLSGAVTTSMEVTVSTTTTTTIIESSSSTNTTLEKNSPSPAGGSCSSGSGSLSPAYLQHHLQHHGSPLHHLQVHHHTAPPSPLAAVRSAQMGSSVANGAGPAAACLAVCCSPGSSHHHLGHVGHLATGHPLPHQLPHQLPHPSLYPLMAAAQLGYAGSSGPSSLVNSPALGRRKRYTSNSSNCSSQFNNNYAGLDVDSLDDMLRKVSWGF